MPLTLLFFSFKGFQPHGVFPICWFLWRSALSVRRILFHTSHKENFIDIGRPHIVGSQRSDAFFYAEDLK